MPCLVEIKSDVSSEKTVPFAMPGAAYKEYPDRHATKNGIVYDIVALELVAVLPQLEFLSQLYESRSGEVSVSGMIFCLAVLADLYHAEPVALCMAGVDEPYNILVGKLKLGHVVCLLAIAEHLAVVLSLVTAAKLFGAHP